MDTVKTIDDFLSPYDEVIFRNALLLRQVLLKNLPGIIEQLILRQNDCLLLRSEICRFDLRDHSFQKGTQTWLQQRGEVTRPG